MQRPAEMIWSAQKASGDPPSKRSGHSMCIVSDSAYIFGGNDFRRPPGPNGDLYKLDMGSSEFYWCKLDVNGRSPEPRSHHTTVTYGTKVSYYSIARNRSHIQASYSSYENVCTALLIK
jgi:Kelch motif